MITIISIIIIIVIIIITIISITIIIVIIIIIIINGLILHPAHPYAQLLNPVCSILRSPSWSILLVNL